MTDFMQNVYVYLWGVIALLMFATAVKYIRTPKTRATGICAFATGLLFVFLTVWYGLDTFGGYEMFEGTLGIVFKIILGIVFFIIIITYFIKKKRKNGTKNSDNNE